MVLSVDSKLTVPETVISTFSIKKTRRLLVDEGGICCELQDEIITELHYHGFINTALYAYNNHYPIIFKPCHFWLLILQAFATHVNNIKSPEIKKWLKNVTDEKITLTVKCDEFQIEKKIIGNLLLMVKKTVLLIK
jgi:hypothetical protein